MDFISIEKGENLFWLGRYVERVYRTLNYLEGLYDVLIDTDETAYKEFCAALNIPDVYEDASDFMTSYFFDELNPDSVYSNLSRAYDDGILLRNTISTRSLAYIQLALDAMEDAKAEGPELCVLLKSSIACWLSGAVSTNISLQVKNAVSLKPAVTLSAWTCS